MIAFTNYDHSLRPFRLSDNETEIIQLLDDGWFPVRDDETPIVVAQMEDGTYTLDGDTILDALHPFAGVGNIPIWGWLVLGYAVKRIAFR